MCLPAFSLNLHAQPSSEHHLPIKTPVQPRAFCEIFSPSGACGTQPVHRQLLATCRTVAQVKIDERLVWNARFCSQSVEVPDRFLVKPDRDLTLQLARIGIPPSFRKIVFLPHEALALSLNQPFVRSEEHTSELQSQSNLVCRLLLEKKKIRNNSFSLPLAQPMRSR